MKVDESTLLAFVDGELDPASRDKVEAVIAHDPALQVQVAALRASCLPYSSAFDTQSLPAMPTALAQRVQALVSVAQAHTPAHAHTLTNSRAADDAPPSRRQWLGIGAAMAASFAAGAWLPWRAGAELERAGWVEAIANYQALYVRETVEQPAESPARLAALLEGFGAEQRQALFVPDLRSAGLAFKRVQRLGYQGAPLIQMVYLPASGNPVALCVLPMQRPDAGIDTRLLRDLAVASWQRQGLAYVMAGEMAPAQLAELARGVAAREFARL